ncbi:MAG: hypothetical protein ACR2FM_04940 [Candidatus Saccharimonadales bacterium]
MAIREGNDNSLPYRSPVTPAAAATPYLQDEQDYNTLKFVRDILEEAIDGLYKEFNAFDVLRDGTDTEIQDKMVRQIAGNQVAYDILSPLKERIDNAIATADSNFNQRNRK